MTTEAKRKIHKFNFKSEGAHVALVDKAANLQEVLTIKAVEDEITVTLPVKDFLTRFFHIWEEDVELLASFMGYKSQDTDSYIPERQQIDVDSYINGELSGLSLYKGKEIPEKLPEGIFKKIEELQKQLGDKIESQTSEGSPLEDNIHIEKGESQVDKTEIEIKELETLKNKADEVDTLKSQLAEMETLKSLVDTMKAEAAQKAKDEMVQVVKGYSFVTEEDQSPLVEFLLKAEDSAIVLSVLEKARDAITAVVDEEEGVSQGDTDLSEEDTDKSVDLTAEILKKRYAK